MTVFAMRGGRTLLGVLAAGSVLALGSTSLLANPIVNYNITVTGGTAGGGNFNTAFGVMGAATADPQKFLHAGTLNDPSGFGEWSVTYNTTSDPDPSVGQGSLSSGLTIYNNLTDNGPGTHHLQFIVALTLPVFPPHLPATFGGNAGMTLTVTPGSEGRVDTIGNWSMWNGMINGNAAASLFNPGFFLSGSNGPSTIDSGMTTIPVFQQFNPVNTIGITVAFDLTPGEHVTFNDFFAFIPSPGALALLGLAGLTGGRRRRA